MSTAPQSKSTRPLWAALVVLAAALLGETAGLISHAGGASISAAILTGGSAFVVSSGTLAGLVVLAGVTADH